MKEPRWVAAVEHALHVRRTLRGINRFSDPYAYFGPGGVAEAERLCADANRALLGFILPPPELPARQVELIRLPRARGRTFAREYRFDTPLPSGEPTNDRVQVRVFRHPSCRHNRRAIVFHHPIYQNDWSMWMWFLSPLMRVAPVVMMAAPHHFARTGPNARYAGEMSMNPNPARMFEAIRQWCWDHRATETLVRQELGLEIAGVVGYSYGAFQSLMLASAGGIRQPIVSIASTNRYAFGLSNGVLGRGVIDGMRRVGIDSDALFRLTDSLQLELHVRELRDHDVLYVRGLHDDVDPHPSLERLEYALAPTEALRLDAGHGTLMFLRDRILDATIAFLRKTGAIDDGAFESGSSSMAS